MKKFIQEFEEIREGLYENAKVGDYAIGGTFGDEVTAFDEGLTREGKEMRDAFNYQRGGILTSDHCAAAFIIALDKYQKRLIEEGAERVKVIKRGIDDAYEKMTKIIIEGTAEYYDNEEADKWTQKMTTEDVNNFERDIDEKAAAAFENYSTQVKLLTITMKEMHKYEDEGHFFKI